MTTRPFTLGELAEQVGKVLQNVSDESTDEAVMMIMQVSPGKNYPTINGRFKSKWLRDHWKFADHPVNKDLRNKPFGAPI